MEWIYKYFSIAAIIAGVGVLIRYLIQKKIDNYFNTKLENHKKELAVMTERAKYDISRKLFDFEAYATKKHTVYPELYKRMSDSWRQVHIISFKIENFNTHFGELDEDGIFKMMDEDILEFSSKLHDALDYYKTNELFLSKDVSESCWGAFKAMRELIEKWELSKESPKSKSDYNSYFGNGTRRIEIIELSMTLLKKIMHRELSYSHFEETAEKV